VTFQPDFVPLVSETAKFVIAVVTVCDFAFSVTAVSVGSAGTFANVSEPAPAAGAGAPSALASAPSEQTRSSRLPLRLAAAVVGEEAARRGLSIARSLRHRFAL
jgi:hypothetical protein